MLRCNLTLAERLLWQKLRSKQVLGFKFRRQYGINQYIVDLYCSSSRIAIEIDGENHFSEKAQAMDNERQKYIEAFRIRFLRFTNKEIIENIEGVLDRIVMELRPPLTPP